MLMTVCEVPSFQSEASKIWSQAERHAFIDWIAANPLAGDVIPGAAGARKVRWAVKGRGKRGGARVIYFHLGAAEILVLVAIYVKSERANLPAGDIQSPIKGVERAQDGRIRSRKGGGGNRS